MKTYRAGFVGTGKVIHLTDDRTARCFDSRRGNNRIIYFAQATSESATEALNAAVAKTGASVCKVCEKSI